MKSVKSAADIMSKNGKIALLSALGVSGTLSVLLWVPRIPQDPAYHHFADIRGFWGIPNAMNVLSSILLVFVGIWGLNSCRKDSVTAFRRLKAAFFTAVMLLPNSWKRLINRYTTGPALSAGTR